MTRMALIAAGSPRPLTRKQPLRSGRIEEFAKERVNTLLLISTLVATITFAAGFTMPGGYNSSTTDMGMATMLRHKGFQVFVFSDTIAMHCSIVFDVAVISAQFLDAKIAGIAVLLTIPLLGISLTMMSIAFTAGIYVVVSELAWLSIAILLIGSSFLLFLLLILIPLYMPCFFSSRVLRYLSYYPFCFLVMLESFF